MAACLGVYDTSCRRVLHDIMRPKAETFALCMVTQKAITRINKVGLVAIESGATIVMLK